MQNQKRKKPPFALKNASRQRRLSNMVVLSSDTHTLTRDAFSSSCAPTFCITPFVPRRRRCVAPLMRFNFANKMALVLHTLLVTQTVGGRVCVCVVLCCKVCRLVGGVLGLAMEAKRVQITLREVFFYLGCHRWVAKMRFVMWVEVEWNRFKKAFLWYKFKNWNAPLSLT